MPYQKEEMNVRSILIRQVWLKSSLSNWINRRHQTAASCCQAIFNTGSPVCVMKFKEKERWKLSSQSTSQGQLQELNPQSSPSLFHRKIKMTLKVLLSKPLKLWSQNRSRKRRRNLSHLIRLSPPKLPPRVSPLLSMPQHLLKSSISRLSQLNSHQISIKLLFKRFRIYLLSNLKSKENTKRNTKSN